MAKSITVKKGAKASGKIFGFRIAPKGKAGSGRIEIGDSPKTIKLDSPEALKIDLETQISRYLDSGYLAKADSAIPEKEVA